MNAKQTESKPLATALENQPVSDFERLLSGRQIEYKPAGREDAIKLSVSIFTRFFCKPTKKGEMPSEEQVTQAVMTCQARELDPWVGDVYLVGYDGQNGPEFTIITSVHALHKRAEKRAEYDGIEAGVVVMQDGQVREITGECYPPDCKLIGGWCKVYRKDVSRPFYRALNLQPYDKGRSLWSSDKAGMIRKCAVAGALREAFPNQCGGLYTTDELPQMMAAATARLVEDRPVQSLSEAAQKASADLDRMLNAQWSQPELPPTLDPASDAGAPDPQASYLKKLADCKTPEEVNHLVSDALNGPDGVDIRQAGEDKKSAMTFLQRERAAGTRKQRPLPGE